MVENRLWRAAAQRTVRNAWGRIQTQLHAWSGTSAAALSAATNLVNAYLSYGDVGVMDLSVLSDMQGIRDKAKIKLLAQQEMQLRQYLRTYNALVDTASEMRSTTGSMRNYLKDSQRGSLIEFAKTPIVNGDEGDGGGVAVFTALPIQAFEELANDLVTMFEKELRVKWLLALEFHNLVHRLPGAEKSQVKALHWRDLEPLTFSPRYKPDQCQIFEDASASSHTKEIKPPSRETLKVYLTALLAEVHINKDRIEEVSRLWSEEMASESGRSPER